MPMSLDLPLPGGRDDECVTDLMALTVITLGAVAAWTTFWRASGDLSSG